MATNDDLMRALMKKRATAGTRAANMAERQKELRARASARIQPTVGGGGFSTTVAGRQMQIPQEERINWGGIIEKGVSSYQAAKGEKDMEKAQEEAVDAEFDIANAIYESTLADDPEGARLIKMTQMGVPGADQALAKHLTPKTQSLAVIVQAMTTGKLDPAMAAELAPQFGLSPELVSKGAEYAAQKNQEAIDQKFQNQAALKEMGRGGSGGSGSDKVSFEEYKAMSPEDRAAYDSFRGKGGRNAKQDNMTPGERNVRAKELLKLEELIREGEIQFSKGEDLREIINDPSTFGGKQKLSQALSEFQNPILGGIGTSMRSKGVAMLEDYVLSEVLDRMAALGGSDSNEELRKMRASLPSAMNNQEAAKALYESVHKWQKHTLEKIKAKRAQLKSGEFFEVGGEEPAAPSGKIEILEILD